MRADILQSNDNPASLGHTGQLQRFLFEDDHDFTRAVAGFLTSKASIHRFVSRGLLAVGVGVVGLAVTMVAQSGGLQKLSDQGDHSSSGNPAPMNQNYAPDGFQSSPLPMDSEPKLGGLSGVAVDQNSTLGSIFGTTRSGEGLRGSPNLLAAQNRSSSSGAQSGLGGAGGGGAGSAPSGGSGVARAVGSSQQVVVATVPDSGSSITLLGLALGVIAFGSRLRRNRDGVMRWLFPRQ